MKKLPYIEGSVFLVPLKTGGYARGVVARAGPTGTGLFGYFFGPCIPSIDVASLGDLHPSKAVLRLRFGDLGLINGKWPMIGMVPDWDRSQWRIPDFARRPPGMRPVLVRYSDLDPMRVEAEYPIEDDSNLPTDSSSGQEAVEIKLTKI